MKVAIGLAVATESVRVWRYFAPVVAALAMFAGSAKAQTVDEVIAKNVQAHGGLEKLKSVQSRRTIAKFSEGSFRAEFRQENKRPDKVREEFIIQGMAQIQAYDGKTGWQISPFNGRKDPDLMSQDDMKSLIVDADMEGPLVNYKDKGHQAELVGHDSVEGTDCYKIKLSMKNGDVRYYYLDADSFLELKLEIQTTIRGALQESELYYGDYEQVNGIYYPFALEQAQKGSSSRSQISVEDATSRQIIRCPRNPKICSKGKDCRFNLIDEDFAAMYKTSRYFAVVTMLIAVSLAFAVAASAQEVKFDSDTISGLGARNIGSAAMSGRVAAIAAVKEEGRLTVYVGAASGGVWKSTNGGTTFKPVFDKEPVQSIGAIAIDPQSPKTIWVGTGETWTRNSVSLGNGIYRSTDGGDSWTNMGLSNSERIARILIDPKDTNTVYACVPGKLWNDSEDRGVYKTTDGGKTWNKVLKGANLSTGCTMISMNPQDPKNLFAGMWDFRRKGWTFRSGGENPAAPSGSGFFKTTDGGATWQELDEKSAKGLPAKPWGRIAVAIAPSKPNVIYAMIESTRSALFRSDDGGKTWEERDRSNWMVWRPFYFANLIVDPRNENKVYKPDLTLIMSEDGGKSFSGIGNGAHGDFHVVWVNPENTDHLIAGDDGGVWYSYDGGNTWWKGNNLPISQFYHVSVDDADPYHVFGGLQDNSAWMGDSQYPGGISNSRWENLFGGDGFCVFPDPADPNYVYAESQGGYIGRVNRITLEGRPIKPQPNYGEGKLRFNWNTPIHMSPNEKGTIYIGAQFLFRSRDHGQSWERISPDLTRNAHNDLFDQRVAARWTNDLGGNG